MRSMNLQRRTLECLTTDTFPGFHIISPKMQSSANSNGTCLKSFWQKWMHHRIYTNTCKSRRLLDIANLLIETKDSPEMFQFQSHELGRLRPFKILCKSTARAAVRVNIEIIINAHSPAQQMTTVNGRRVPQHYVEVK